mgnify:FL=1
MSLPSTASVHQLRSAQDCEPRTDQLPVVVDGNLAEHRGEESRLATPCEVKALDKARTKMAQ